ARHTTPVRIQTIYLIGPQECCMTDVKGFFYPRTASGRSSLIPSPPWYYSGDLLTVEYRTDPARVAELLPAPLALADEDPGAVALIWADWQSCSSSREELLDPVRSQYKEAFVVVRCSFQVKTFSRCVYIWVDKDVAFGRGMHQGARRSSAPCGRPGRTPSRKVHHRLPPAEYSVRPSRPATRASPRVCVSRPNTSAP